jgi:hypothetical protein
MMPLAPQPNLGVISGASPQGRWSGAISAKGKQRLDRIQGDRYGRPSRTIEPPVDQQGVMTEEHVTDASVGILEDNHVKEADFILEGHENNGPATLGGWAVTRDNDASRPNAPTRGHGEHIQASHSPLALQTMADERQWVTQWGEVEGRVIGHQ